MKRIIPAALLAIAVLAGIMVLLLHTKEYKDVPLAEVDAAFLSSFELEGMEKAGDMRMKRAFGLNAADYKEYLYYAPDNTMSVNELLIIKTNDESQAAEVLSGIQSRIDVQKKAFDGYGTNQTDLLEHAKILAEGPYVCLFISEDAQKWCGTLKKVWEE